MSGYVLVHERYEHITRRDDSGRGVERVVLRRGDRFESADETDIARLLEAGAIAPADGASAAAEKPAGGDGSAGPTGLPEEPRKTGTTDEWRAYAIALHKATGGERGLTADQVADLGRNDIIELLEA